MEWMLVALRRYAEFSGRSRRKEYWMFVLFIIAGSIVASILDTALGLGGSVGTYANRAPGMMDMGAYSHGGWLTAIFGLAMIVPGLAVTVRRLHDIDRSGWWILIGLVPLFGAIVLLVFMILEGTRGPNRFGPDPLAASPT